MHMCRSHCMQVSLHAGLIACVQSLGRQMCIPVPLRWWAAGVWLAGGESVQDTQQEGDDRNHAFEPYLPHLDPQILATANGYSAPVHVSSMVERNDWSSPCVMAGHSSTVVVAKFNPKFYHRRNQAGDSEEVCAPRWPVACARISLLHRSPAARRVEDVHARWPAGSWLVHASVRHISCLRPGGRLRGGTCPVSHVCAYECTSYVLRVSVLQRAPADCATHLLQPRQSPGKVRYSLGTDGLRGERRRT
jgi:hypothetical protein